MLAEVIERLPLGRRPRALHLGELMRHRLIGRVSEALAQFIEQHTEQRIRVIAHGGVIWGTLTHYFPEQRRRFSKGRQVANGSITRIAIKPEGAELISLNETAHLGDVATY